jgi:hypothetical protein
MPTTSEEYQIVTENARTVRFPVIFLVLVTLLVAAIFYLVLLASERSIHHAVIKTSESANENISRLFIREFYPDLAADLALEQRQEGAHSPLDSPALARIKFRIHAFVQASNLLDIVIIDRDATVRFADNFSQIGRSLRNSPAIEHALRGSVSSEIRRQPLEGGGGWMDIIVTTAPLRSAQQQIVGVVEIHADRSPLVRGVDEYHNRLRADLIPLILALLLAVVGIIWRFYALIARIQVECQAVSRRPSFDFDQLE